MCRERLPLVANFAVFYHTERAHVHTFYLRLVQHSAAVILHRTGDIDLGQTVTGILLLNVPLAA